MSPWLFWAVIVWALAWKGWALWVAARANKKWWFIILLVVNTLGIFEMIYIFFIERHHKKIGLGEPAKTIE